MVQVLSTSPSSPSRRARRRPHGRRAAAGDVGGGAPHAVVHVPHVVVISRAVAVRLLARLLPPLRLPLLPPPLALMLPLTLALVWVPRLAMNHFTVNHFVRKSEGHLLLLHPSRRPTIPLPLTRLRVRQAHKRPRP